MDSEWQLVLHEQAWDFSHTLTSAQRTQLKRALLVLASDPHQRPDALRRSPAARDISVKYVGRFRILYWLDAFVREVRVVEIDHLCP